MGTGFRDIVAPSSSTGIGCLIRSYRVDSGQVPPCPARLGMRYGFHTGGVVLLVSVIAGGGIIAPRLFAASEPIVPQLGSPVDLSRRCTMVVPLRTSAARIVVMAALLGVVPIVDAVLAMPPDMPAPIPAAPASCRTPCTVISSPADNVSYFEAS